LEEARILGNFRISATLYFKKMTKRSPSAQITNKMTKIYIKQAIFWLKVDDYRVSNYVESKGP